MITQTIGRAAAKTFLQAFLSILVLLAVPVLTGWADSVRDGEQVAIDLTLWTNILIAASGGGLAALISAAWNWSKAPDVPAAGK